MISSLSIDPVILISQAITSYTANIAGKSFLAKAPGQGGEGLPMGLKCGGNHGISISELVIRSLGRRFEDF